MPISPTPKMSVGRIAKRYHAARRRLADDPESLRTALLLAAGELIAIGRPESSAAVIAGVGELFPDLAGFTPRIIGPDEAPASRPEAVH